MFTNLKLGSLSTLRLLQSDNTHLFDQVYTKSLKQEMIFSLYQCMYLELQLTFRPWGLKYI